MQYAYEVDVTPSDTTDDPIVYTCKLSAGILTKVSTLFEVGDGYSTCVQIWTPGAQLIPTNADSFLCGDAVLIESPTWYNIDENFNTLFIVAWNRGGVYDHSVNVMFDVRSPDEPDLYKVINAQAELMDRLISLIRSMI